MSKPARPRFPSQFDRYYAPPAEDAAEVSGFYAAYSVEYGPEPHFTSMEEAFFSAGDELSAQADDWYSDMAPTVPVKPMRPVQLAPAAKAAPAAARKKQAAASGRRGRRAARRAIVA